MSRRGTLLRMAVTLSGVLIVGVVALAAPNKKPPKHPAKSAQASSRALIANGMKVYAKNNCAGCHAIKKKGGKMGPDLTHVGKKLKGAKIVAFVRNPKKLEPKGMMPAYDAKKIDAKQLKALVAYLSSLK